VFVLDSLCKVHKLDGDDSSAKSFLLTALDMLTNFDGCVWCGR
jgi:hypothetical protein